MRSEIITSSFYLIITNRVVTHQGAHLMRKNIKLNAFILLIVGTLGLLMNEYILHWGRFGTLLFAAFNMIAIAFLCFSYWDNK